MVLYDWLLLGHVLAAIAWVGGGIALNVIGWRTIRLGDPDGLGDFAGTVEWFGLRVSMPASLLALAFGVLLVLEGPWAFSDAWVGIGLGGLAFSFALGAGFLGPESGRLKPLLAARGPADAEVRSRIMRLMLLGRIELVVLLLVVAAMVLKPGG